MTWTPKNPHDAFRPICLINAVLCLTVFEFRGRRQGIFTLFYGIITGSLYFFFFWMGLPVLRQHLLGFGKLVYYFILYVNIFVALASVVTGWYNSKFLRELKDRVGTLDTTLMKLGMANPYREDFRRIVTYLALWWSLLIMVTIAMYIWTVEEYDVIFSLSTTFILHIPTAQNFVVDLSFNVCVRCVHWRLVLINDLISKAIDCELSKRYDHPASEKFTRLTKITVMMSYEARKKYIKHFIETVKQSHLEVVRLSRLINRTFSKLILLELAVNFTVMTGSLYSLYFVIMELDVMNLEATPRLIATSLWVVVVGLKISVINRECDLVQQEVVLTGQILRDFNRMQDDDEIRDEIQQFCMQSMLHPIYFCAAGFVRLDNYLTRAFFGTVTTYVVILIQMSSTPSAIKAIMEVSDAIPII